MTLPNLVGCGAAKAGTTSLSSYLAQHPEVYASPVKEIGFFGPSCGRRVAWYESHFAGWNGEPIVCEFTPWYMLIPEVANRIAHLLPEPRVIVSLRNPIDRAYSDYLHHLRYGAPGQSMHGLSFFDALDTQWGQLRLFSLGLYARCLNPYFEALGRDRVYVAIFEEWTRNPTSEIARLYRWLGIDADFVPEITQENRGWTPRNRLAVEVIRLWRAIVKPLLGSSEEALTGLKTLAKDALSQGQPHLTPSERNRVAQLYAPSVGALRALLDRSLACWADFGA